LSVSVDQGTEPDEEEVVRDDMSDTEEVIGEEDMLDADDVRPPDYLWC